MLAFCVYDVFMARSIVGEKSFAFAVRVVHLYRYMTMEKKEFVLSKQLLRVGTSIGSNVREALAGISRKDFLAKMYISFTECSETMYWLELLKATDYLGESEFKSMADDCGELLKLLASITKTTQVTSE